MPESSSSGWKLWPPLLGLLLLVLAAASLLLFVNRDALERFWSEQSRVHDDSKCWLYTKGYRKICAECMSLPDMK